MSKSKITSAIVVGLVIACSGCGSGTGVKIYRLNGVTGSLTVNGDPVPEVNVQLIPVQDKNKAGVIATGVTNSKGQFSVSSPTGKGAVEGLYKVVLSSTKPMSDEERTKFLKEVGAQAAAKSRPFDGRSQRNRGNSSPTVSLPFPSDFMSVGTTPKEFEVQNKGNTLELKL